MEHANRLVLGAGGKAYQLGDLVFRKDEKMFVKLTKVIPNYLGPY